MNKKISADIPFASLKTRIFSFQHCMKQADKAFIYSCSTALIHYAGVLFL
jgi:hypothetical protein